MIIEYQMKEREMLERALSRLRELGGIEAVLGEKITLSWRDRNLPPEELERKLILGIYQYITSDPNGDLTTGRLTRFLGLADDRGLTRLIRTAFPDRVPPPPRIPGSIINILRREAGMDNSYVEEVIHKYPGLKIGRQDITKDIRIPPRIDGEIVRSTGWISTTAYIENCSEYVTKNGLKRACIRGQYYELSFKRRDLPFIELEFIPFFEEYFNYTPFIKPCIQEWYGRKILVIPGLICHRAIVSFYRDVLGIHDKKGERTILFHGELRRYFIAGLIDMWGCISFSNGKPSIQLVIPPEFKKMAEELEGELGHKLITLPRCLDIHFGWGRRLAELIEEYPISNPRLLYPILWWKQTGELRKYPLD